MKTYNYQIRLRSDAEPACGLGNELLNGLVPRDMHGNLVIPASHLKGIMRENLAVMLARLLGPKGDTLVDFLFGRPGEGGDDGDNGKFHLSDAVAKTDKRVTITRTAINDAGTAKGGSLRTTEAIAAGTTLKGKLTLGLAGEEWQHLALLSLLSVSAIGGNRSRGSGNCKISVEGVTVTPGELLQNLLPALEGLKLPESERARPVAMPAKQDDCPVQCLRLHFRAEGPLCLPERPVGASNVISSGFVIPATAVTGVLLNLLNQADAQLATDCFASGNFRCWPLLPAAEKGCNYAIRVSNSHKISKFKQPDQFLFGDTIVPPDECYDWRSKARNTILKGCDGVLNVLADQSIQLWRERDMPRLLRAHGVINGFDDNKPDNLFTTQSLCVHHFTGLVMLPAPAAELLLEQLQKSGQVCFGKSRTTRGQGMLTAEAAPDYWQKHPQIEGLQNRLFIVQSPLVLADDVAVSPERPAAEYLQELLTRQGWGKLDDSSVAMDVHFGWNRHRLEKQVTDSGRVRARRVILPGSVFLLKDAVDDLAGKLLRGLQGDQSHPGHGAVAPHPGIASRLYEGSPNAKVTMKEAGNAARMGYQLHEKSGQRLSASQIAALLAKRQLGMEQAKAYLEDQKLKRTKDIWDCWQSTEELLQTEILKRDDAVKVLRVWLDLCNAEYQEA